MPHEILPHGTLKPITDGLWQVTGTLPIPLTRNMTVLRRPDGTLLLYSVVALDEAGMKALEALGRPSVMVVPHPAHLMDAPFYRERYPDLTVVAAPDAAARLAGRVRVDATPDEALPALGLRHHLVPGMRVSEVVLDVDVPGGRALVYTDLVSHVPSPRNLFMRLLGPPGGTGTPRIVRFRQVRDKKAVRAYLREQAGGTDLRIVLGAHGSPIVAEAGPALSTTADNL